MQRRASSGRASVSPARIERRPTTPSPPTRAPGAATSVFRVLHAAVAAGVLSGALLCSPTVYQELHHNQAELIEPLDVARWLSSLAQPPPPPPDDTWLWLTGPGRWQGTRPSWRDGPHGLPYNKAPAPEKMEVPNWLRFGKAAAQLPPSLLCDYVTFALRSLNATSQLDALARAAS